MGRGGKLSLAVYDRRHLLQMWFRKICGVFAMVAVCHTTAFQLFSTLTRFHYAYSVCMKSGMESKASCLVEDCEFGEVSSGCT